MTSVTRADQSANTARKAATKSTHSSDRYAIRVRIEPDGREVSLEGRAAWALSELVKVGKRGLTASDYPAGIRLAHYILICRKAGFVITTEREAHVGVFSGVHARYSLATPVTIIDRSKAAA